MRTQQKLAKTAPGQAPKALVSARSKSLAPFDEKQFDENEEEVYTDSHCYDQETPVDKSAGMFHRHCYYCEGTEDKRKFFNTLCTIAIRLILVLVISSIYVFCLIYTLIYQVSIGYIIAFMGVFGIVAMFKKLVRKFLLNKEV